MTALRDLIAGVMLAVFVILAAAGVFLYIAGLI